MINWKIRPADPADVRMISTQCDLHPAAARALAVRGLKEPGRIERFLKTDLNDLAPPFAMEGLEACAERIRLAVERNEKVLIFGDYDVDGLTATAMLVRFFRTCGMDAAFFIPDRIEDGYGITADSARKAAERGPSLVITVDCGTSAVAPVRWLVEEQGIDVIVTDHHQASGDLPPTPYFVNPKLIPGTPYEHLCAAGVAFKLAWGAAQKVSGTERVAMKFRNFLIDAVPLVALGTVADIVPLLDENRILVGRGLSMLPTYKASAGINALFEITGLDKAEEVTTFDIGFKLGPRLNAAGRMDNAGQCVSLLVTDLEDEARAIAATLEAHNRKRQALCESTVSEALALVSEDIDTAGHRTIVAGRPGWHRGIVGIVASKLADRFHRPAVVLAGDEEDQGLWHGSARSVGDFDITAALKECRDLLERVGGHKGAAGLAVREANLEAFRVRFEAVAAERLTDDDLEQVLDIDAETRPDELDLKLARDIGRLEPFGEGNRKPYILTRGLKIARYPKLVGANEKHLKLSLVSAPGALVDAIGFSMGSRLKEIIDADALDLVFFPTVNRWQGRTSLDLHIKDLRIASHDGR